MYSLSEYIEVVQRNYINYQLFFMTTDIPNKFPSHTANIKCRKFDTNIPRKGISGPLFPHSCGCEQIIYSHDGSACSAGGNSRLILGIYKSLKDI